MQTRVNATIQFGLVNIAVGVCTAVSENKTPFRKLHRDCGTPIKQHNLCPNCDKPVNSDEIVKGIEVKPNAFVFVEESELDALQAVRSKFLVIDKFIPAGELLPILIKQSYWLQPASEMSEAYSLLLHALEKSKRVAIGNCVLWGIERPCAVLAENKTLALRTLYCHDEIITPDVRVTPPSASTSGRTQLALAMQIIEANSKPLEWEKDLVSESRQEIREFVNAKAEGMTLAVQEEKLTVEQPPDLMAALKATLAPKPARKRSKLGAKKVAAK